MKVAVLGYLPEVQIKALSDKIHGHELIYVDGKDREKTKGDLADVDIIIAAGFKVNSDNFDIYDAAKKLKLIQVPWVGVEGTDFEYLKKRGITMCNSRWNSEITAEFTVSLLMTAAKKIVASHNTLAQGSWEARGWPSLRIKNSNIMILGHGTIPREIIRMLAPYNVNFTALRRTLKDDNRKDKQENVREITWAQYDEAAATSDVIICVLPLTSETKEILDEKKFAAMKKGSIFINVGRGLVVKEEALYNALKSGHLGAAAVDVWYNYNYGIHFSENTCFPGNFPFHELPNMIMSPHRACSVQDGLVEPNYWNTPVHNINALSSLSPLCDVINSDVGY